MGVSLIVLLFALILIVPVANAENVNITPVATAFITIDPIGNHTIGDVFFINGTTNLPVSENLTLEIRDYAWTWRLHMKNEPDVPPPGFYAYLPHVAIIPDIDGINQWSVNVTDASKSLVARRYEAVIFSEANNTCNRWGCPGSSAANLTDFTLFQGNTSFVTNFTAPPTQTFSNTLPLPSTTGYNIPLPWHLSIMAIFAVLLILKIFDKRK